MKLGAAVDKSRRTWNKVADRYDNSMAFWERHLFRGGREWVCSLAVGRTLEVAIGTGRNLSYYPPGVELVGVELSPRMLAFARERASGLDRPVELREGDAHRLPFEGASFDTVVCVLSLCAIADDRAAVAEMHRVLKPGGRLLLFDHVASTLWPIRAIQWLAERLTIPLQGEHLTRQPLAVVNGAGFDVVELRRSKAGAVQRLHARKPIVD